MMCILAVPGALRGHLYGGVELTCDSNILPTVKPRDTAVNKIWKSAPASIIDDEGSQLDFASRLQCEHLRLLVGSFGRHKPC